MTDCTQLGLRRLGPGATMLRALPVFLVMAVLAPPASADFKRGERALGMLDYAGALVEFRSALADGERRALFEIGLIYERGQGVPADPAEAARWYRKAVQEAAGLAPRALAMRALARVEGKDAPPPVAPRVESPAPPVLAEAASPPPVASLPVTSPVESPASPALAEAAPPLAVASPPVTRPVESPAPPVLAEAASPPPVASLPVTQSARTQFRAGLYGEPPPFFTMAFAPAGPASGPGPPAAWDLVYDLATVAAKDDMAPAEARLWAVRRGRDLFQEGRYAEATPFIEKALELSDQQLGPEHVETGALLQDLAKLMRIQGRYAEAEPLYKHSVDVFEKALGAENSRVADSLDSLAGLYLVRGLLADSEPLFERSLVIREKAFGPAHPLVAASLNNLAELYRGQGRFSDAEPLHKRALDIFENVLGPVHPNVALILSNLSELYRAQGRATEARPLNARSLEILLYSGKKPPRGDGPAWPTASPPGLL